jgi:general stress protein 26
VEPARRRPPFRDYGLATDDEGLLPWEWAEERVVTARNYWLATTRHDGRPHAMPIWGVWLEGAFFFGTGGSSAKARNLDANPAVVLHLESGDETVIVEGTAELVHDADLTRRVNDVYEPKYGWRVDGPEGSRLYAVRPRRAYAWAERDYTESATQFDFG